MEKIYEASRDGTTVYVPTSMSNGEYQAHNIRQENNFEGADVDFQSTSSQQGSTVYQNKDPETVYKYSTEKQVVINEAPAEVVMIEAEKDSKAVLIPIALSVVLVVILAICVRQLMNRPDKEQLEEASKRAMKIKNLNEQELSDCK